MKKIFVSKEDGVAEVVEKVISEPELELVIVIPRDTTLDDSVSNFNLIKREALAAGKHLIIESVDEKVLSLSKTAGIESIHPILSKRKKSSSLSDIVVKDDKEKEESEEVSPKEIKVAQRKLRTVVAEERSEESEPRPVYDSHRKPHRIFKPKRLLWVSIPLVVIIIGFFLVNSFRKAEITINFKTMPFEYEGKILTTISATKIDNDKNILPAEIFTEKKNLSELYPASSHQNVSEKATGKILIYNNFSSTPQSLVVNTRFVTPDGKIFRLTNSITVPGAQIKGGQIVPASIEAKIVADKPGPEYNLETVDRLSIPGFKGSPKFDKFYGSLVKTSGGFIGNKAVPTDKDIAAAKGKIIETLKSSLGVNVLPNKPNNFKILDAASEVRVTRTSVNKTTDEKGSFSVFGEAELRAIGFQEKDLQSFLLTLAEKDNPSKIFKTLNLTYGEVKTNFDKGELSFSVKATGVLTENFDQDSFKSQISGKNIDLARQTVLKINGLSDAKVSVWPSWASSLPKDTTRIKILIN